ncbi:MAG: AAA family ATPase [Candidatus Omnitrophota bacterium]
MIIGLTGANASGKGEAAEYLKSKGFEYYSLSDILREEARVKGIEPSRENLIMLGNKLRREKGLSILAELAIKKIKDKRNYIIDSVRSPFEIKALRQLKGFTLIGIDAPVETRFNRILSRNRAGDPGTLEDFIEKERKENISADTNQQLENCLKLADKIIINDSTIEEFHKRIYEVIKKTA